MIGNASALRPTRAVFDALADLYDGWYDSTEGAAILREELACLRLLCPERRGRAGNRE